MKRFSRTLNNLNAVSLSKLLWKENIWKLPKSKIASSAEAMAASKKEIERKR